MHQSSVGRIAAASGVVLVCTTAFLAGCSEATTRSAASPTSPLPPADAAAQLARTESALDIVGCALSAGNGTIRHVARISRTSLPTSFPNSSQAPRDVDGRRVLHVLATEVLTNIDGIDQMIGIACVAPMQSRDAMLADVVLREGSRFRKLAAQSLASAEVTSEEGDLRAIAARALMQPLVASSSLKRTWRGRSRTFDVSAIEPSAIERIQDAGRLGSTLAAVRSWVRHGMASLVTYVPTNSRSLAMRNVAGGRTPMTTDAASSSTYFSDVTVTIWNSGNTFIVDSSQIWGWLQSYFGWDGNFDVEDYTSCSEYSAKWFAMDAELTQFENDSLKFADAIHSTDDFYCKSQGNAQKKCIDLFIASKTAGPLNGDGRPSDPNASYDASRMQVYLDLDGNSGTLWINGSTSSILIPRSTPPNMDESGAWVYILDATHKVVQIQGYTGYCALWLYAAGCPAADAFVKFAKQTDGSWSIAEVRRDAFPTMDVYDETTAHTFQRQYHSDEESWTRLFTRSSTIANWKRAMGLPPGCHYE